MGAAAAAAKDGLGGGDAARGDRGAGSVAARLSGGSPSGGARGAELARLREPGASASPASSRKSTRTTEMLSADWGPP